MLPLGIFAGGFALVRTVVASKYDECWSVESTRTGMTLRELAIQEGVITDDEEHT